MEWKANSSHVGMPAPKDKALAENVPLLAAYGASTFNRTVSKHGFAKKGRSMVTQDLVDLVGPVYEELYGEGSKGKL
jgi:ATP-dependent NAD(P)H-hydrate dehydratase